MNAERLLSHRLNNLLHAGLLLLGLGGLVLAVGYVLGGAQGALWTTVVALAVLLLGPRISPGMILRRYQARPLHPREAPGLYALVERLAQRVGLPHPPGLHYLPSAVMNAFSVGRREEAAIALSDGLLRGLPPRELTAVLAHEVSHIGHNDMWVMSLADSASRVVRLLSIAGQLLVLLNLPLLLTRAEGLPWVPLLLLVFAPSISALLQLALSRNREFDADLEAARITGDPLALAQALTRMEAQQEGLWRRLLWPGAPGRQPSLLRTHPASAQRIERLRSLVPAPAPAPGGRTLPVLQGPVLPPEWEVATQRPRRRWWY